MNLDLDEARASMLARIPLAHLGREYPSKLDHVIEGDHDLRSPRALHPIFYGSFDWHSCVHGYWTVASLLRRFPSIPEAARIREVVDAHFTAANVAVEVAYLARPSSKTFERPYGWGWLLALAAELSRNTTHDGRRWASALRPLATAFADRFLEYLPRATYPVRAGTHGNTAFALALAMDWATVEDHEELARVLREKAIAWFASDRDCQAWEPSGDDFLSPALVEAECMRRALEPDAFAGWLARFLPGLTSSEPATLFTPASVSDRTDGKIVHLDGLNSSRAWCHHGIAHTLAARDPSDPRIATLRAAGDLHLGSSLPHIVGDYMGDHWLASFALLALLARDLGNNPSS